MIAYGILYHVRGTDRLYDVLVDAKNLNSAKKKIARKHKGKNGKPYKDGRMIVVDRVTYVGYY